MTRAGEIRAELGRTLRSGRRVDVRRRAERRRSRTRATVRLLATCTYLAAALTAAVLIQRALDGGSAVAAPSAESVARPPLVASSDDPEVASTLVVADRLRGSVVTLETSTRRGTGFVGWVRGSYSYVVTAAPVVAKLRGARIRVGLDGETRTGRLVAVRPDRGLALVRVRGSVGQPLLGRRGLGWLKPALTTVAVPPASRRVGAQVVLVSRGASGGFTATGRSLPIGAPLLAPGGKVAGVITAGGDVADAAALGGCRSLEGCFPSRRVPT